MAIQDETLHYGRDLTLWRELTPCERWKTLCILPPCGGLFLPAQGPIYHFILIDACLDGRKRLVKFEHDLELHEKNE